MSDVFWEKSYQKIDVETFGKPSREIVEIVKKLKDGSRILDIGCGEGRHSICCASQGHIVDAIDISSNGINKLLQLSSGKYKINAQVSDIASFETESQYDLIIAHGVLQFLSPVVRDKSIQKMKKLTKVNGYNAIAIFTDSIDLPPDLEPLLIGVLSDGEINNYYDDWCQELYESYEFEDEHEGGIKHRHAINKGIYLKKYD